MNPARPAFHTLLAAALLAGARPARADVVELKNGTRETGQILKTDGQSVTLEKKIGAGTAEIPYPLGLIAQIRFEPSDAEKQLLQSGDVRQLGDLEALWRRRQPFLALPESDAAAAGLACLRLLLAKGTKSGGQEAVKIADTIMAGSWDAGAREEARRARLSALAAAGKVEQALAEAETLQGLPSSDDAALAETQVRARFLKAELALKQLGELEEEWPKWDLMPELRKRREALLAQAIDDYLFPAAFHPSLAALCAEGLWKSCELFLRTGHPEEAARRAREIAEHFPVAPYQEQARRLAEKPEKEKPPTLP
jgi:hypothetical protein